VTIKDFLNKLTTDKKSYSDEVNDCLSLFSSNFGDTEMEDLVDCQRDIQLQQQRLFIEKNCASMMNFPTEEPKEERTPDNSGVHLRQGLATQELAQKMSYVTATENDCERITPEKISEQLECLNCETLEVNSFDDLLISEHPFKDNENDFNYNNELLIFHDEVSVDLIEDIIEKNSCINAGEKITLANCVNMLEKVNMEKMNFKKKAMVDLN